MRLMRGDRDHVEERSDADLVTQAAAGDDAAFSALYRRHAPAAWGVANAVTGNPDDAADAVSDAFIRVLRALQEGRLDDPARFRGYLTAAARNAALDVLRKGGRLRLTDDVEAYDRSSLPEAHERVAHGVDAALVASAFRGLPERWRSVLWLTEVEGMAPREAAGLLGLSANSTAQLAVRARAGLRERYLQAHIRTGVARDCRDTCSKLGAYVAGRLAPRDLAKVDQHLAGCDSCRARKEELEEVGAGLRRVLVPLPLVLGGSTLAAWKAAAATAPAAGGLSVSSAAGGILDRLSALGPRLQKPLMAASTGVFAMGVIAASSLGAPDAPLAGDVRRPRVLAPRTPEPVTEEVVLATSSPAVIEPRFEVTLPEPDLAGQELAGPAAPVTTTTAPPPAPLEPSAAPPPSSGEPPASTAPAALTVTAELGPVQAGVSVELDGDGCNGVRVGDVTAGCAPEANPQDAGGGATISTEGELLGPLDGTSHSLGL